MTSPVFNNPEAIDRFLKDKCRSGNISPDEAHYFFDCLIQKKPAPHMASFTILFNALVKNNHHETVISLLKRFNSTGLLPNLILFNVLLNCVCNRGRACDGFVVLGRILRLGFSLDAVTFTSLIKCLCREGRIMKATQLFKNMNPFGCRPNGMVKTGLCKPNIVSYSSLIDGLCNHGLVDKAKELFLEMKGTGIGPVVVSYTSLIQGLCYGGKWEDAKDLIDEMVDQHVHPNVVTFTVIMDDFCKNGKIDKANELLELMVKRGVNPDIKIMEGLKKPELREKKKGVIDNTLCESGTPFVNKKVKMDSEYKEVSLGVPPVGVLTASGKRTGEEEGKMRVKCASYGLISSMGRRRVMEDAVVVAVDGEVESFDFFVVYDRHSGSYTLEMCRDRLHLIISNEVEERRMTSRRDGRDR
ncbi:hypothetical protein EZV62_009181 [Acer yangbiense]|uniref:Uncharacterized protein n=1 Tax=Acer yangbiense TaxID=1000413 RepID=A0A5C7IHG5_9ROSI|nr:hypothetical protein EZV62_009181 [Acer yangbiense]